MSAANFLVSGLRSIAASEGFTIQASELGKTKMFVQIFSVVAAIIDHHWKHLPWDFLNLPVHPIALASIWVMVGLSLVSAVDYFVAFWRKIDRHAVKASQTPFLCADTPEEAQRCSGSVNHRTPRSVFNALLSFFGGSAGLQSCEPAGFIEHCATCRPRAAGGTRLHRLLKKTDDTSPPAGSRRRGTTMINRRGDRCPAPTEPVSRWSQPPVHSCGPHSHQRCVGARVADDAPPAAAAIIGGGRLRRPTTPRHHHREENFCYS